MALKVPAPKAAEIAIGSIGRGYDICTDLRLKYCKGDSINSRLIEIDEDDVREVVLPGGVSIPNVSKSIKCDKGERTRFRSDVLSFQQMSEQFNQELSLAGKIPSGLFNAMFEFSGSWQKDAAHTKTLAFDGVLITLYTVALEKSQMVLCDHVKNAVPPSWDPPTLARFIETFGTHIIVGMKMGGKDVIYLKQQHSSTLQPADVQKRLKEMADRRFLDSNGQFSIASDQVFPNDKFGIREQRLTFANISPSSSYSHKEDIVSIWKRRGGSDGRNISHNEWLQTVQLEPDVISMSFIPITSLLNGVPGSGFLSHAINLYLRYKPPIEELHQFLEFQLPRQWAPVFSELPLGPQRKQRSSASLQFSFMGPKLYVNTIQVDVGKRPVTGLRLYLEGKKSNRLAIHLQHLSSLPKIFQLEDDPNDNFRRESYDRRFYEKVQWKNFSHVCTAPVESEEDLAIVTGAQLQVENYGIKNILFLRLRFSTVLGAKVVKHPEWDGSPGLGAKSGLISTLISQHFTATFQKPPPRPADVNINSAVYPGGPPVPVQAPKLLKFVDTTEMTRGPQETPGYWVVSGARLLVEKGKISLRVKYSLLTMVLPDEELLDDQ
ncbi:MACPF domain-containing protein At4g24290 [Gastrolobium bilobum]|uniref:MACPF domain-containing protein At4g24290 n=1 Tax=Gastrolobium bilobum TaxID=150636 RepID=UPI002AB14602|nr:MACPF domain-containing protein At4g24290 [Gastrolobium bilobum]XP_061375973.1 MACPF domain-containing protein At4g24290 [Gastrolobium bilobum]XP_061375974.1 MACPF domain-containing protein At4g24290 [Gastrolobium bilobum]XP_061375975.1 MACPF domain-containing protein At4g24290 [Gastrolobium bilobum]